MTTKEKIKNATKLARIIKLSKTLQRDLEVMHVNKNIQGLLLCATDSMRMVQMEYEDRVIKLDGECEHIYNFVKEYI